MLPLILVGVLAQAAAGVSNAADAADLDRLRKKIAQQPPVLAAEAAVDDSGKPVFRVKVRGWTFDHAAWHDESTVPLYVRPSMPPVHFEFLQQVTPEFFRSSVLYPGSPRTPYGGIGFAVDVVPVLETLARATKKFKRRMAEQAAREEVRQAIAGLEACRANPARPGC